MRTIFLLTIFTLFMTALPRAEAFDHTYSAYDRVLKKVVRGDRVDYKTLKNAPDDLQKTLHEMTSVTEAEYITWTDKQKIAFWVNAYNATILKFVVDHYPVESIKKLGPPIVGPWVKKRITLLGTERSFYEIENSILRKQFNEPRIHFALNCASRSCPTLQSEPYVAQKLDQQLDDAGKTFLQDAFRNRIDMKKGILFLSKIFDWYQKDFTKTGTLEAFLLPYLKEEDRTYLLEKKEKKSIEYLLYDWSLNDI